MALRIYNALANGMGGIDWQGLPLMVALHQVDDVELLIERLLTIKYHRPPTEH